MASAHPSGQQPHLHADTSRADTLTSRVVDSQSAETPATFVSPPSDLLTVIGRDACFKRLSPTFPPAFGYREADLLDRPFIGFIHPADRAATSAALDKLAQGEPTLGLENRFRCKDGAHRRLTWTALPTPEGLLYAVARDITERRQRQGDPAQSPAG